MYRFLVGHFSLTPFKLVWANRRSLGNSLAAYPSLSSNALDGLQSDLTILLESVLPSISPFNQSGHRARQESLGCKIRRGGVRGRGNVVDCLMLACRAALWDTKVPRPKRVEYRAPRRHPTQGDVGMDVDVDREAGKGGGLETKGVSTATDFELTDYWDKVRS
jgi:exosome complex component RRP42